MSEKIPTIGKVWLIAMAVIQGIGIITNVMAGFVSTPLFFITAALEAGAVVGAVFMVLGKGLPFYILYSICYAAATIIVQFINPANDTATSTFVSTMVGTVIGLGINLLLTFLAAKNTFKKEK